MKKIVLLPKTDTVILCLPEQWVGIPVICELKPMTHRFLNKEDWETEISRIVTHRNKKQRKKKK